MEKIHIFHSVPSVTNGLATVRVGKTGLILNIPEIRYLASTYLLYAEMYLAIGLLCHSYTPLG